MAKKTLKGYQLAELLANRGVAADVETCSLIARHSQTMQNNAIAECSGHPIYQDPNCRRYLQSLSNEELAEMQERFHAHLEKSDTRARNRIEKLVATIDGIAGIHWQGDPRGTVVRLAPAPDYQPDRCMRSQPYEVCVPVD